MHIGVYVHHSSASSVNRLISQWYQYEHKVFPTGRSMSVYPSRFVIFLQSQALHSISSSPGKLSRKTKQYKNRGQPHMLNDLLIRSPLLNANRVKFKQFWKFIIIISQKKGFSLKKHPELVLRMHLSYTNCEVKSDN